MKISNTLVSLIAIFALAMPTFGDVVGWRMDGDGRYPDANPPMSWSTSEGVVWKTSMPAWSNSSPVLVEGKSLIVVLSEPDEIIAVNAKDGSVVWKDSTGDIASKRPGAHKTNGWTSPTPVTDGSKVFSVFGSGVVAAHDLDGQRQWARIVDQPKRGWGHSASPVLAGGNLIVHIIDVVALDPKTGKELWRAPSDPRWGSPVAARIGGTEVVITPAGDVFRADDGKTVASAVGSLKFATPVVQNGVVYFIEKKATAVRLPESLDGSFEELWIGRAEGSRHYASVVIHDGLIYAVSREQSFSILDAASGEVLHKSRLDLDSGTNTAYPSITLAGDKVFVSTENGTTAILEPGREYKEVARNSLESFRSSPVFDGNRMYVRAFDHLYCIASE